MTDNTRYWIWLTQGVGYCSPKPKALLSIYSDIKTLYHGGENELRLCGIFTEGEINKLLDTDISVADSIISRSQELGLKLIDITDATYPKPLISIDNPPAVIYVQGDLPDVELNPTVSIIGTRKATTYGIRTAFELGANLSREGFVVVSGGALGIDCAAHRGVLQEQGVTVCVLGCGIDYDYLRENKSMRDLISVSGAVISEYPPGTSSVARHFPERNRIISGLCEGLIVVEAPKASGSMITVGYALSQSRDVFAVMGNIDSPYSEGTNALIKDGAIPVTSYRDVSEYYLGISNEKANTEHYSDEIIHSVPTKLKNRTDTTDDNLPVPVHKSTANLSEEEKTVYYILSTEPMHVDEIVIKTGLPVYKVTRILSSLEMSDYVQNSEGRHYTIK